MNISVLAIGVVAFAVALLGAVTLLSNSRRLPNRIFSALCLFASAYTVINYFADHDPAHALFWVRTTFFLASFMLLDVLQFTGTFPRILISRSWRWWLGALSTIVAIASYSPTFIPAVNIHPARADVIPGPAYWSFLAYVAAYLVGSVVLVAVSLKRSGRMDRERTRYVAAGFLLTAIFLVITNLILPLLQGSNPFAYAGSYSLLIFAGLSSYAMIRHRLFDIRLVVARSLAYLMLLGALGTIYGSAIFAVSKVFFTGTAVSGSEQATYIVLAILVAFTFQPLQRFFEKVTDRIFFRNRYDSQEVLNQLSTVLVTEMNLERILHDALKIICQDLHIGFGQFMIFKEGRIYKVEHLGPLPDRLMIVPNLLKLDHNILVADELNGGERKHIMESHGIRASARLRTHDDLVGFLLLGDKLSGDIYSEQDIELIQIAAKELAVAISNARAYEEIQEFNATLQEKVKHATTRLRTANRHLKELDKAKDEFISMASHQLRTPLTTIKGYLSMILEGDTGSITETQREFIQHSFEGSERMVSLISDLLNVSRLSAGRFLIEQKPTDVAAMIADEIRQLMPHATAKNLYLKFEPPKEVAPLVDLDENKTRQVIMNFIDNAIYYTQTGGVTVRLKLHDGVFRVEVSDTGIGVPDDAKKHLFTKFFRAGNAQNVRPDGTGLGLYLARRVVEDQGGTIIFESSEGHGSTFGFELPVKGSPAHATAPAPKPEEKVPAHV